MRTKTFPTVSGFNASTKVVRGECAKQKRLALSLDGERSAKEIRLRLWFPRLFYVMAFGCLELLCFGETNTGISPEQIAFFENKIRPILSQNCLECHSAEKGKVKGGLNMDTRHSLLKGGENGAAIHPGSEKESTLIQAVEWKGDLQMPPKKKLSDEQIAALKEWVLAGAADPRETASTSTVSKRDHWAFQPVARPGRPEVRNANWCKNSVDYFVLEKLEAKGMSPAELPETGSAESIRRKKEALLRRAYFDLIGIPPTPLQLRQFVADQAPDAFAKVVDNLLASPMYGERWARHWMDTARYADTTGNKRGRETDYRYAYAWSYRDWLITALNEDMPYDRFLVNQLAADKVAGNDPRNLAALGFLTVGQRFRNQDDVINDQIDVVGRGMLGLTLACARCHDHKFDPITQADYYALRGVFASSEEPREGPEVSGNKSSASYMEFQEKLQTLETHAVSLFYQAQREGSMKVRQQADSYFLAARELSKKEGREGRDLAEEIREKHQLDRDLLDAFKRRWNLKDPILGPFVRLCASEAGPGESLKNISADNTNGKKIHPVVAEFLHGGGVSSNDPEVIAALFRKFCSEKITPLVGPKVDMNADPIKDLANSDLFAAIARTKPEQETTLALAEMELAVFPYRLVIGTKVTDIFELQKKRGDVGGRLSTDRAIAVDAAKINELKLSFQGRPVKAMVVQDKVNPMDSPLYPRGNKPKAGETVRVIPRRFIEVLSQGEPVSFKNGSGRLELAEAIANKANPLAARVLVNRIWMHHFGEGLVRTPDDLGNQAGKPTHPELLDFLASWFMEDYGAQKPAWSVKALHRAIMLSSTYQQSSTTVHLEQQQLIDASNSLLWRANVRRLDFDAFRDSLLSMAGVLDTSMYGPPINLVSEPYSFRRSVYGYIDRGEMPELLMQFDMANPQEPNSKRTSTIVPQQALFLMNSPFCIEIAHRVVKRPELVNAVQKERDVRAGISLVFQMVLQRSPRKEEADMALKFLQEEARLQQRVLAATSQIGEQAARQAEEILLRALNDHNARKPILNKGELVERTALSPWETLVQALMFCNEAAYLN